MKWLPDRTIPVTAWRSERRWSGRPATLFVLIAGLWLFGTGEALLVVSDLGVGPWTVLAQGVGERTGSEIGWATFWISVVVLALWIPLRERPGLGTLANAVVIALALQLMSDLLPQPEGFAVQLGFVVTGIAAIGLGSGLYLTTNLGPGPRDGWMTGVHNATGWPVAAVRFAIEVCVMALGWVLGGTVGLGTVLFALLIGPSVGYGLLLVRVIAGRGEPVSGDGHPELEA